MLLSKIELSTEGQAFVWNAYAVCDRSGASSLASEIAAFQADANLRKPMDNLWAALEVALMHPRGPQLYLVNPKLCHEAVSGTGIYELIKRPNTRSQGVK